MEYIELFEQLQKQEIRYLVCGGLAVNIYGIPRMTADIDILLDFEEENISRFENAMEVLEYHSSIPVSLITLLDKAERDRIIKDKNLIAYSFFNSRSEYMTLDVLIDVPFSFDLMWNQREIRKQDDLSINIVSLQHLIDMKKYSDRQQDNDDVLLLTKLLSNA
jgi:hypothetical protein